MYNDFFISVPLILYNPLILKGLLLKYFFKIFFIPFVFFKKNDFSPHFQPCRALAAHSLRCARKLACVAHSRACALTGRKPPATFFYCKWGIRYCRFCASLRSAFCAVAFLMFSGKLIAVSIFPGFAWFIGSSPPGLSPLVACGPL